MSSTSNPGTDAGETGSRLPDPTPDEALSPTAGGASDDWVPEDRTPSAAENNFMSFALFGFLILFGISCFILF